MTAVLRRNSRLLALSIPLICIALAGLLAPLIAPYAPNQTDLTITLQAPSAEHWLGTDQLGRDQFSRIIWAARTSMTVTAAVVTIAFTVGVVLGSLGAYAGGLVDRFVTWSIEFAMSVPTTLLALTILGIWGGGIENLILALSIFAWASYARIARGAVMGYRNSAAASALVGLGAHPIRILLRHVVPAAARPSLVFASTDIGSMVMATASLSFLGLGIAPPTPEWGQMLVESRPFLATAWWLCIPPGVAITAVALSSNLIGEHLGIAPELRRWRIRRSSRKKQVAETQPSVEIQQRTDTAQVDATNTLRIADLHVKFDTPYGIVAAVHGINYQIRSGEVLALVGESGSGKTVSTMGPLGLAGGNAHLTGNATYNAVQLVGAKEETLREVRGGGVAVVFQDPYAALNPLRTIGSVVTEALRPPAKGNEARERVVELLDAVGLPNPETMVNRYPHELSGGMCQRVLIATALASNPTMLIADEPTSSLDVTLQAEVLALLGDLVRSRGLAMILISHDLAVVADFADRVMVLVGGKVVEEGPVEQVINNPVHPCTRSLLASVPVIGRPTGTRFFTLPEPKSDEQLPEKAGHDWCTFANRCPYRVEQCLNQSIPLELVDPAAEASGEPSYDHRVACLLAHSADLATDPASQLEAVQ